MYILTSHKTFIDVEDKGRAFIARGGPPGAEREKKTQKRSIFILNK